MLSEFLAFFAEMASGAISAAVGETTSMVQVCHMLCHNVPYGSVWIIHDHSMFAKQGFLCSHLSESLSGSSQQWKVSVQW